MASEAAPRTARYHHVAERFSHVGNSGLYDKARPAYPAECARSPSSRLTICRLVEEIVRSVGKDELDVLDVGAGTGIFSRLLLPYPEIRTLTAVEPVEGMRVDWQRNMDKAVTPQTTAKLSIIDGIFENIPLPTASVDLITIAQAFHWADYGGYEPAMAEFARLLRPGGRLALIWCVDSLAVSMLTAAGISRIATAASPGSGRSGASSHCAIADEISDAYEPFEDNTPQYRRGLWRAALETTARKTLFEPNEIERHVERSIPTSEQGVVDRVLSKSYINALDAERQSQVEADVRKVIQRGDGIEWIDEAKGEFRYPYRTVRTALATARTDKRRIFGSSPATTSTLPCGPPAALEPRCIGCREL